MLWIDEGGGFHENCVHETVYKWSTNENKFESVGEKKRFPIYMYNNPPPPKKMFKKPKLYADFQYGFQVGNLPCIIK